MNTLDLYSDDFPHGTREGYAQGCKGDLICRSAADVAQTCRQAHHRFGSDWRYSQLVKGGMGELEAVVRLAEMEQAEKARPQKVEKPKTPRRAYAFRQPLDSPDFPHGTERGGRWGCRTKCPATPSCTEVLHEADRIRQRAKYAREKARKATLGADAS